MHDYETKGTKKKEVFSIKTKQIFCKSKLKWCIENIRKHGLKLYEL